MSPEPIKGGNLSYKIKNSSVWVSDGNSEISEKQGPPCYYIEISNGVAKHKKCQTLGELHKDIENNSERKDGEYYLLKSSEISLGDFIKVLKDKNDALDSGILTGVLGVIGTSISYFWLGHYIIPAILTVIIALYMYGKDKKTKSCVILYDLDSAAEKRQKDLMFGYEKILECSKKWVVISSKSVHKKDRKTSGGAQSSIDRKVIEFKIWTLDKRVPTPLCCWV